MTSTHVAPEFEHLGYFKEYYVNNKLIGHVRCEKDRELTGYAGRKVEILTTPVTMENGRKIKPHETVMTMLYPLSGKILNR